MKSTNPIPTDWLDPVKAERVICHWTAGSYTASALDREHYHILIEGDGELVKGKHPIKSVLPPLISDAYAAHTLNLNSWSIGVAVCCMAGAAEFPFAPGPYPITQEQWDQLVSVLAQLAIAYKIPVSTKTILTHAEVQANLSVAQRGKWDITVYPRGSMVVKGAAAEVGAMLRAQVEKELESVVVPPKPEPSVTGQAGWIIDSNGSRFMVSAGWRWEGGNKTNPAAADAHLPPNWER